MTPEVEDPNVPECSSAAKKRTRRSSKSIDDLNFSVTDDEEHKRGTQRSEFLNVTLV